MPTLPTVGGPGLGHGAGSDWDSHPFPSCLCRKWSRMHDRTVQLWVAKRHPEPSKAVGTRLGEHKCGPSAGQACAPVLAAQQTCHLPAQDIKEPSGTKEKVAHEAGSYCCKQFQGTRHPCGKQAGPRRRQAGSPGNWLAGGRRSRPVPH